MKTVVEAVTILPDDEVQARSYERYPKKTIRTDDGQLMVNRLVQLINDYGDRVVVPRRIITELLREHKRKSRMLKQTTDTVEGLRELVEDIYDDLDEVASTLFTFAQEAQAVVDSVLDYAKSHNDTKELSDAMNDMQEMIDSANHSTASILAQYVIIEESDE